MVARPVSGLCRVSRPCGKPWPMRHLTCVKGTAREGVAVAFSISVLTSIATMLALVGVCVLIEMLVPRDHYPLAARRLGAAFQVAQVGVAAFVAYPLGQLYIYLGLRPLLPSIDQWAGVFAIPFALLAVDFLRYWEHRFEHRFMWPVHVVHHSPEELHAANAYGHPLQAVPMFFLIALPFSLLNFQSAATPVFVGLIVTFMGYFIHSSADFHLGPLRAIFVDNRYHRIHHSLEPRHFDHNFGIVFTLWDRLFGTEHFPSVDEWPEVGVEGSPPPKSIGQFLAMPFRGDTRASTAESNAVEPQEATLQAP